MIEEKMKSRFVPTKITPGAVLRAAQHADAVLASDGAGGYCWPDFAVAFNAIFTIVRGLELLAQAGGSIAILKQRIPAVAHKRASAFCPGAVKGPAIRTTTNHHPQHTLPLTPPLP